MPGIDLAIFVPSLAGGGAERVMVVLANAFAARGKRVHLVVGSAEGPYSDLLDGRVELVSLDSFRLLAWPLLLAAYLRRTRPKALLSALSHANLAAIAAKQLSRVPARCVVSEHSTIDFVVAHSARRLTRVLPMAMRLVYPFADRVVAVSDGAAAALSATIGLPRHRIDVIHNPVEVPGGVAPPPHPWFASGAPPVIVTAGRMTAAKDHGCLIDAFAQLRGRRACRLVILGEGPLRRKLEEQAAGLGISEHVLMPGFQSDPFAWMRGASVFALSSHHEGLPVALIEAMACGTPVVSTDCPSGPAEILENGKWGRLVPVGDSGALADAIAATLDEPQHPDVARRAADFSVDRAMERYARVLGLDR